MSSIEQKKSTHFLVKPGKDRVLISAHQRPRYFWRYQCVKNSDWPPSHHRSPCRARLLVLRVPRQPLHRSEVQEESWRLRRALGTYQKEASWDPKQAAGNGQQNNRIAIVRLRRLGVENLSWEGNRAPAAEAMARTLHPLRLLRHFWRHRHRQRNFQHYPRKRTGLQRPADHQEQFPDHWELDFRLRQDLRVQPAIQKLLDWQKFETRSL